MRIRIPCDQASALRTALAEAGRQEIGGQLFGEQLAPSDFRATHVTIQRRRGTFSRFVVDLVQAAGDALGFYRRMNCRYEQHNYLGEWHSHPSFEVAPSSTDRETMRRLVRDASFRGNFAVLMITRLDASKLTCAAWLFDPRGVERQITLENEQ